MKQHLAIIGTQWGDEGKGKFVDYLAKKFDLVVRFQGGANAGHTVVAGGEKFALHLIPSGILQPEKICFIGDGVIVHPETLIKELTEIKRRVKKTAKLYLGNKAQLVMPWHLIRDGLAGGAIGTTGRGIGPCYADATARSGIRVMDWQKPKIFKERVEKEVRWNKLLIGALKKFLKAKSPFGLNAKNIVKDYQQQLKQLLQLGIKIVDTSMILSQADKEKKKILFEGAQATLLDITHGDYPFVTASHPTLGGVFIGTGFRPKELIVMGVAKAYCTRVGNGPFPTELTNKLGETLRERGGEFGTTTGRPRRCGWLDLAALKYAVRINGIDELALTKLDVLSGVKELKVAVGYRHIADYPADVVVLAKCRPVYKTVPGWKEDLTKISKFNNLPQAAQNYVRLIEREAGVKISLIGVGPSREQLIRRKR